MSNVSPMFTWRGAILKSDLPPTTRHVLLTLATHMDGVGNDCFPSIKRLCEETGLSNRAVITHLQSATDLGWITVGLRGFKDQRWKAHEYHPSWPPCLRKAAEVMDEAMNGIRTSSSKKAVNVVPNAKKGDERHAKGGEPHSKKAVNVVPKAVNVTQKAVKEVHTSTSESTSESTSLGSTSDTFALDEPSAPEKPPAPTDETFFAFSDAYFLRYGINPLRDAKVNGTIANFIKRVGKEDAPHIAAFYVRHNDSHYIRKHHPIGLLLSDAEGLRTQWATGRTMTARRASEIDDTATNLNAVNEAIAMLKRREKNATL